MKPHERRKAGAYPFYGLSMWNSQIGCWKAGKKTYPTEQDAKADAQKPGLYRIVVIDEQGKTDLEPFEVK